MLLEKLKIEAIKFNNSDDFIQSSRLTNMLKWDIERLNKIKALSEKKASYIYGGDYGISKAELIKKAEKNINEYKKELAKLPKNELAEQMPDILPKNEEGWFKSAEDFYNKYKQ